MSRNRPYDDTTARGGAPMSWAPNGMRRTAKIASDLRAKVAAKTGSLIKPANTLIKPINTTLIPMTRSISRARVTEGSVATIAITNKAGSGCVAGYPRLSA